MPGQLKFESLDEDPATRRLIAAAVAAEQVLDNLGALDNLTFTDDELAAIDEHAVDGGIDLWQTARQSRS